MTIRVRGSTFVVDVAVPGAMNPTGIKVRARKSADTMPEAYRLEALMRHELIRTGQFLGVDDKGAVALAPTATQARQGKATGTLLDALDRAINDSAKGWHRQKAGKGQEANARAVIAILGEDTLCRSITAEDFDRAGRILTKSGNSSDTVARKLQAFSRTLYFATKSGWIKHRVAWDRPPEGKPRQFIFTPKLEAQVIAHFESEGEPDMAEFFAVGIDTAARLTELAGARFEDVDFKNGWMLLKDTKNGETRAVTLYDRAKAIIKRRKAVATTPFLFPGFNKSKVARRMRMARNTLGFGKEREFTFHAARATGITRLAQQGVEFATIMDQAGHKSPAMTRRYIRLAPEARTRAILASVGQVAGRTAMRASAAPLHPEAQALRAYRALVASGMAPDDARGMMAPDMVARLPEEIAA